MSKESVENRRAFFKNAVKTLGTAALAVPFLAASAKAEVNVAKHSPVSYGCDGRCSGGCKGTCDGCEGCSGTCKGGCYGARGSY